MAPIDPADIFNEIERLKTKIERVSVEVTSERDQERKINLLHELRRDREYLVALQRFQRANLEYRIGNIQEGLRRHREVYGDLPKPEKREN